MTDSANRPPNEEEEEKKRGLLDTGSGLRTSLAIGTEIGLNTVLDAFSVALPLQQAGGMGINYLAQRIRGGPINRGEMIASGIASLIPGGSQYAAASRGGKLATSVGKGALSGAIQTTGEEVINTGELPSFQNFATGTTLGGVLGGTFDLAPSVFKGTLKSDLGEIYDDAGSFLNSLRRRLDGGRQQLVLQTADGVPIPTTAFAMSGDTGDTGFAMTGGTGGDFVQPELPISRFQTVPYQQKVVAKMREFGMPDGTFRMKAFDSNKGKFKGNTKERRMLEAYLSPDRLKGSFSGFKKANKGSFQRAWGDFLESKGLSGIDDIQVHHINALYDSIHLFDGVTFNSKEYWDIITTLLSRNARTGTIQRTGNVNNLMVTLGKATNIETPHGIAHKLYNDLTPNFFSPKEMSRMSKPKGFTDEFGKFWKPGEYRIHKAKEWAKVVNNSEEVILEAHKQWSALNPKIDVSFDDLIEYMSKFDDTGFNKLLSNEYQLPDIKNMILDIKLDMMLNPSKKIPFPKVSELKQEILVDRARGLSNKEMKRKYGKKFDIKQLDLFD